MKKRRQEEVEHVPAREQGGVYFRFQTSHLGDKYGASQHVKYITREDATLGKAEALVLHDEPERITRAGTYEAARARVIEYHTAAERAESRARKSGPGRTRSYFRVRLSFEGKVETEKASEMVKGFLEENFPRGRAVAAIHQDTDHTHVHIHLQARDRDGKKYQFEPRAYRSLDESWARIYGREFGVHHEENHLRKKAEKREWRRAQWRAKEAGLEVPEPPQRVRRPVEKARRAVRQEQVRTGDALRPSEEVERLWRLQGEWRGQMRVMEQARAAGHSRDWYAELQRAAVTKREELREAHKVAGRVMDERDYRIAGYESRERVDGRAAPPLGQWRGEQGGGQGRAERSQVVGVAEREIDWRRGEPAGPKAGAGESKAGAVRGNPDDEYGKLSRPSPEVEKLRVLHTDWQSHMELMQQAKDLGRRDFHGWLEEQARAKREMIREALKGMGREMNEERFRVPGFNDKEAAVKRNGEELLHAVRLHKEATKTEVKRDDQGRANERSSGRVDVVGPGGGREGGNRDDGRSNGARNRSEIRDESRGDRAEWFVHRGGGRGHERPEVGTLEGRPGDAHRGNESRATRVPGEHDERRPDVIQLRRDAGKGIPEVDRGEGPSERALRAIERAAHASGRSTGTVNRVERSVGQSERGVADSQQGFEAATERSARTQRSIEQTERTSAGTERNFGEMGRRGQRYVEQHERGVSFGR